MAKSNHRTNMDFKNCPKSQGHVTILVIWFMLWFAMITLTAQAATNWTDGNVLNSDINDIGNWDNGLPSAGNDGTISVSSGNITWDQILWNWGNVIQSGGNLIGSTLNGSRLAGSTVWTINGGKLGSSAQWFVRDGATLNINTGGLLEANGKLIINISGSTLNLNGGTISMNNPITVWGEMNAISGNLFVNSGDGVVIDNGGVVNWQGATGTANRLWVQIGTWNHSAGTFTAQGWPNDVQIDNGGVLSVTGGNIISNDDLIMSGNGYLSITGGNITIADDLTMSENGILRFGTGDGSFMANNSSGPTALNISDTAYIDFLKWTKGQLTLAGYTSTDYKSLWDSNRLYWNGQNKTDLGGVTFEATLFQVTGSTLRLVYPTGAIFILK